VGVNLLSYDLSSVGRADGWPVDWLATARHSSLSVDLQPRGGDLVSRAFRTSRPFAGRSNPDAAVIVGWICCWMTGSNRPRSRSLNRRCARPGLYTWITAEWAPSGAVHSRTSVALTSSERSLTGDLSFPGAASAVWNERRDIDTVDLRTNWVYLQTQSLLWELGAGNNIRARRSEFQP